MFLHVRQLEKRFGREPVLQGLDLTLEARHTLSILGRSGSGKTTLLKLIAGLEVAEAGTIHLDGLEVTGLSPQERGIVYLYQEPLLFPHLDVFENIAFGLRLRHLDQGTLRHRVGEMLRNLGLQEHVHKMPHQLSGGQRQRVAFGRAIIVNPPLLLLDEPFGSLDAKIRAEMQHLFKQLATSYQITTIFVTHDLKEAMLMGDRLAVLRTGHLVTYASQEAFIDDPETGVTRIDVASIDRFHKLAGTRKAELTALFESRGMVGDSPDPLIEKETYLKEAPSFGFWGATEDMWLGGNWARGRALQENVWKRDGHHNFCAILSGGRGFLGGTELPQEISIQLWKINPCCPGTRDPLGDARTEKVADVLARVAQSPVFQRITEGNPPMRWASRSGSRRQKPMTGRMRCRMSASGATSSSSVISTPLRCSLDRHHNPTPNQ